MFFLTKSDVGIETFSILKKTFKRVKKDNKLVEKINNFIWKTISLLFWRGFKTKKINGNIKKDNVYSTYLRPLAILSVQSKEITYKNKTAE